VKKTTRESDRLLSGPFVAFAKSIVINLRSMIFMDFMRRDPTSNWQPCRHDLTIKLWFVRNQLDKIKISEVTLNVLSHIDRRSPRRI